MFHGASGGAKVVFGLEYELTLHAMNALGTIYVRQERLAKAEAALTMQMLDRLGLFEECQRKPTEYEAFHLQAIEALRNTTDGRKDVPISILSDNLGMLFMREGRLAEAQEAYRYAVAVYQRMIGPEHRATFFVQEYRRSCYKWQGKPAEAEALSELNLI